MLEEPEAMKNLLAALRPHLTLPMAHYQAGGVEATYLRCTCGAKVRPPTEAAYLRHLAEAIRAAKVERARLPRSGWCLPFWRTSW